MQKALPSRDDGSTAWSGSQKRYDAIIQRANAAQHKPELEITFAVAADGTPTACWASKSSGTPDLDWATCFLALRRAHFTPRAAPYNFSATVHWRGPPPSADEVQL